MTNIPHILAIVTARLSKKKTLSFVDDRTRCSRLGRYSSMLSTTALIAALLGQTSLPPSRLSKSLP